MAVVEVHPLHLPASRNHFGLPPLVVHAVWVRWAQEGECGIPMVERVVVEAPPEEEGRRVGCAWDRHKPWKTPKATCRER